MKHKYFATYSAYCSSSNISIELYMFPPELDI